MEQGSIESSWETTAPNQRSVAVSYHYSWSPKYILNTYSVPGSRAGTRILSPTNILGVTLVSH